MFPNMVDDGIMNMIEQYREVALGWKLSGAGGGGYLILVSETPIEPAVRVKIRRKEV
jgi:mevalonate kinase